MMEHIIVSPFDWEWIETLQGKAFVIRTSNPDEIQHIHDVVSRDNKLHSILLENSLPLSALEVLPEWKAIPITIFSQRFGIFREFIGRVQIYRELNVRVFLSSDYLDNFSNLQILASLGINCGLYFGSKPIDWQAVNDLMAYAIYGKFQRATIEPFNYIAKEYKSQQLTDFNSVYFDNPKRYCHVNQEHKVALSSHDLANKNFIIDSIEDLPTLRESESYQNYIYAWQEFFMKEEGCAFCPAWRICIGKFSGQKNACQEFFLDMLEAAEFAQKKNNPQAPAEKELCQL